VRQEVDDLMQQLPALPGGQGANFLEQLFVGHAVRLAKAISLIIIEAGDRRQ